MNRPLVLVAAAVLAFAALPASAQPGGGRGIQLRQRTDQLEQRIRRGETDGSLDRREADRALGQLAGVRRMEDDLLARNRGVLTRPDQTAVSARLDELERSIHWRRAAGPAAPPADRGFGERGSGDRGFAYGFGRDFWRGAPASLEQRADWLEGRIRHGVDDGSLTRGEAARAQTLLRDFRGTVGQLTARDGGRLTRGDRARLSERLDGISRQIHWLQTNNRRD